MKARTLLIGSVALAALLLPWSAAPASALGTHPHIMIVVEENRNLDQVIGSWDMPYLNSLANTYASFRSWRTLTHPSEPNYIAMIAGSTLGVTDDGHHDFGTTNNLGAQLTAAGVSWKAYFEGLPYAGYTGDTYAQYARKHDPFIMFSGNGDHVVPGSQLAADTAAGTLPDFVFYVPDLVNDGHDAPNSVVDAHLKATLTPIMAGAWYTQGGTIVVTYDEDVGQGVYPHVVVSENARSHWTASGNVYSDLRTIEDAYGLPKLGAASSASSYASILGGTASTPPPPSPPPSPSPTGTFSATFSPYSGNNWWVQTNVASTTPMASVCASVNGGACRALTHQPWGAWAASFFVATGSSVVFTATSSAAATATSGAYAWPSGTLLSPSAGPTIVVTPSAFTATFLNMRGNAWWVETDVTTGGGTLAHVDASVNGGTWITLSKTSWGSWAKSINAPSGSQVRFRAVANDGASVTSAARTW